MDRAYILATFSIDIPRCIIGGFGNGKLNKPTKLAWIMLVVDLATDRAKDMR
ncbi:hypothetical protein JHK82_051568 [Glycine max]|uniref:Uncharacterized protein n=2 Tax=Glycine subgen. Soja TaxID=1462606 RepID=A0A0R0F432_SOYBN|nr:hypothetical protein JHK87_051285 [Glycine soja]KAG4937353.1 hypothetical protein JHK85_052272 [Glycine max]KAG5092790.1 hypothetical protein JHK82_051568 [Glycine max]KAG5095851.1 hypothetical protein JHK84_051439 [Glycine max]KAH1156089.1 hypothetical protein GYH30_051061 [Glycine max]